MCHFASSQTLGSHTVKIRVDDEIEAEYAAAAAAEGETPVVAATPDAADDDASAAKGASKKKEVKLQVLVTRR